MRRYVNCYPGGYTTVHRTAEDAKINTKISHSRAYAVAVEIELPDPPVAGHLDTLADKLEEIHRLCEVALDEDDDLCVAFVLIGELCSALIEHANGAS